MQDNKVVILAEKIKGSKLPQCVHQMRQRIDNPRDFRAALAVGEQLYSLYKYNQVRTPPTLIPDLCTYFDVGKMKMYECCEEVNTNTSPKKKEKLKRSH